MNSTIDEKEVEKFSAMADEWWDENGNSKPLHKFNPIRIEYIKKKICQKFNLDFSIATPLSGIKIIDIGCGGGLICEPFCRMKADVVAIDASKKNIEIAKIHAQKNNLAIDYRHSSAEEIADNNQEKFDVVLALEIIEHVADVESFVDCCSRLLKPGGILFIATLNRTAKSLLLAKIGAEYILRWLPIGTHSWKKFLRPSEVNNFALAANLKLKELNGFSYNLLKDEWKNSSTDLDVNYIAVFENVGARSSRP